MNIYMYICKYVIHVCMYVCVCTSLYTPCECVYVRLLCSAAFVACEYILSWDSVYPPYLCVATGTMATILFWRYMR